MGRTLTVLLTVALLALWITSIAHNQAAVGSDEQTIRHQLTTVAGPPSTSTPTPLPSSPTTTGATATQRAG